MTIRRKWREVGCALAALKATPKRLSNFAPTDVDIPNIMLDYILDDIHAEQALHAEQEAEHMV